MKRFFFKGVLIATLVFLGLALGEFSLRKLPNDYSYKADWMRRNANTVQTLIIGASDGLYGINPLFLDEKAFNLSFVSQSLDYSHFLFEKYLDCLDSLNVLILTISYPMAVGREALGSESYRCKYYNLYFGDTIPDHNYLLLNYKGEITWKNILRFWTGKDIIHLTERGFGTDYKLDKREPDWKEKSRSWADMHTEKDLALRDSIFHENTLLLDNIIDQSRAKGVRVVIVTLPVYEAYYSALSLAQTELQRSLCTSPMDKYDNVIYLDYSCDKDFTDDDFYDACHLSESGAEKLTRKLRIDLDHYATRPH